MQAAAKGMHTTYALSPNQAILRSVQSFGQTTIPAITIAMASSWPGSQSSHTGILPAIAGSSSLGLNDARPLILELLCASIAILIGGLCKEEQQNCRKLCVRARLIVCPSVCYEDFERITSRNVDYNDIKHP